MSWQVIPKGLIEMIGDPDPAEGGAHDRGDVADAEARRRGAREGLRRRLTGRHALPAEPATLRAVEDYTHKYKGEQVEVELFGGEYQDGTLTAYCGIEGVPHLELNGHILIPLQNIASLHCSSRCDAPEPDWPPRGLTGADGDEP